MDLRYKIRRVIRLSRPLGLLQSVLLEIKITLRHRLMTVWPRGFAHPLQLRYKTSDLSVLESVLVEQDCHVDVEVPVRVVVDAGANVGITTAFFASRYPEAQVIAIEPDATNFERLQINTTGYCNVRALRAALWHTPARVRISNPQADSWSKRVVETEGGGDGDVQALTPEQVLGLVAERRIDLFKIDIEGAERGLFEHRCRGWLDAVRIVVIESHSDAATELIRDAAASAGMAIRKQGEKWILYR